MFTKKKFDVMINTIYEQRNIITLSMLKNKAALILPTKNICFFISNVAAVIFYFLFMKFIFLLG